MSHSFLDLLPYRLLLRNWHFSQKNKLQNHITQLYITYILRSVFIVRVQIHRMFTCPKIKSCSFKLTRAFSWKYIHSIFLFLVFLLIQFYFLRSHNNIQIYIIFSNKISHFLFNTQNKPQNFFSCGLSVIILLAPRLIHNSLLQHNKYFPPYSSQKLQLIFEGVGEKYIHT